MKNDINENSRLSELSSSDFTPAKGEPDIRGWLVKDRQGNNLGKVAELLIDSQVGKVRYLVLDLKNNNVQLESNRVLIPIGLAILDAADDVVKLPQVSVDQLRALPAYEKGKLNRETEIAVQQALAQNNARSAGTVNQEQAKTDSSPDFYDHSHYQYANIYNGRKAQSVIGLFNTVSGAQTAVDQLEHAKINKDKIELVTRQESPNADLVKVDNAPDSYDHFFYSLFSSPADATANLEAARKSNAIVVVYTTTPEETRLASAILQEYNTAANDQVSYPAVSESNPENTKVPLAAVTPSANINPVSGNVNLQQENNNTSAKDTEGRNHIVDRPVGNPIRRREQRGEHLLGNPTKGEANFANFQPGIIELVEHTEMPVIRKVARVVEEVSVQKIVEEHEGLIKDSVRHTEVDIQKLNRDDSGINK